MTTLSEVVKATKEVTELNVMFGCMQCNGNVMQSTLQYNYDYLVCGNHNNKIILLLQLSYATKQGNENTIINLFALQGWLHLTKHYIRGLLQR